MALTADTYTHVLPEVAEEAAERVAALLAAVERVLAVGEREGRSEPRPPGVERTSLQVMRGTPSGTRTPNPLIKSQLLCQLS